MQRIFNFADWATIGPDAQLKCGDENSQPRVVVLHVNAEDKCKLFVRENGVENFLAIVEGRDEIQFAADGEFELFVIGGFCSIKTAENADWTMEEVDNATFTTIVERRIRNPELEQMMYMAQRNIESRLAAQQAEYERRLEAKLATGNVGTPTAPASTPTPVAPAVSVGGSGKASGLPEAAAVVEPSSASPVVTQPTQGVGRHG